MYVPLGWPASPSSGSAVIWSPSRRMSAEDSAILSALMIVATQDRLEFLA
jgi:hypothetical protein